MKPRSTNTKEQVGNNQKASPPSSRPPEDPQRAHRAVTALSPATIERLRIPPHQRYEWGDERIAVWYADYLAEAKARGLDEARATTKAENMTRWRAGDECGNMRIRKWVESAAREREEARAKQNQEESAKPNYVNVTVLRHEPLPPVLVSVRYEPPAKVEKLINVTVRYLPPSGSKTISVVGSPTLRQKRQEAAARTSKPDRKTRAVPKASHREPRYPRQRGSKWLPSSSSEGSGNDETPVFTRVSSSFSGAGEETRTLDLLHGKQSL